MSIVLAVLLVLALATPAVGGIGTARTASPADGSSHSETVCHTGGQHTSANGTGSTTVGGAATGQPVANASIDRCDGLESGWARTVLVRATQARERDDGEQVRARQAGDYEAAARAGAEDALAALENRGVEIDDATRAAAIQGAIAGATLVEQAAGDTPPSVTTVRVAASGAVRGAIDRAASPRPETIRSVVSGALAGGALSTALGAQQGGLVAPNQVFAAAHGGADGAVTAISGLSEARQATLTAEHVQFAAFGGAGGAAGAASLVPIFGDRVMAANTQATAFGASAGALQGTAEQLDATGRVDPGQTLGSALGASAGTLSGTLQNPQLTRRQLSNTAYTVARETVRRADTLTRTQMLETALTTAVDRLVGDVEGDAVFPSAIVLPTYNIAIGPPRDVDADGEYEDVNGNRVLTYADVVSLSIVRSLAAEGAISLTTAQRQALDFNDDSVFDWRDIRALDAEITAATNGTV